MKKFRIIFSALLLSVGMIGTVAYAEPTQEELLAQYYAALAKQQAAQAATSQQAPAKEASQEELLAQYYAALAKMNPSAASTPVANNDVEYRSGNYDNSLRLQNAFNNLPANVANFLRSQGSFKIYACSYDEITAKQGGGTLGYCPASFTISGNRKTVSAPVYIGDRETQSQSMEWVLYHELGHAVDNYKATVNGYKITRVADTVPAIGEVRNYTSSNTYSNSECFAQAFAAFLLDNQNLQAKAPSVYAYMMTLIGSL